VERETGLVFLSWGDRLGVSVVRERGGAVFLSWGGRWAWCGERLMEMSEILESYIYTEPFIEPRWALLNGTGLGPFNRGRLLINNCLQK
jgi:hypothetical protein